jgi:hypothetical protein
MRQKRAARTGPDRRKGGRAPDCQGHDRRPLDGTTNAGHAVLEERTDDQHFTVV